MATIITLGAAAIVVLTSVMLVVGSATGRELAEAPDGLRFVFVIPCRDEGAVIRGTVDRLLAQRTDQRFAVLVVDDASTDDTPEVLARYAGDPRVWIVRRTLPDARTGKSAALNAAYRSLREKVVGSGASPDGVVVVVLDADGRLDRSALDMIAPYFAADDLGSVQVGVRVDSTRNTLTGRLQDIELAEVTDAIRRGRSRLGSTGFGGNGQFVRLSALMDRGDDPWSGGSTQDLDLGVHLVLDGWRNEHCPAVTVSEPGVESVGALARRRTKWYEGQVRALRLVPDVLRSSIGLRERVAMVRHLLAGATTLLLQTMSVVWLAALTVWVIVDPESVTTPLGAARLVVLYLLVFGRAPFIAVSYWRAEPTMTAGRAFAYAHAYLLFGYGWWASAIRHVLRTAQRGPSRVDRIHDDSASSLPTALPTAYGHLSHPAP